jgi:rhamnopyranosyl-N-acetylglucosaminyl-diphospho-decaprenol beta-1,3/1,4-galactofuranosyltransferase
MPDSLNIAAVFATMNRGETAKACVLSLASQTRPPELVVVADNCSTDATTRMLRSLKGLPFRLVIHQMPENQGNAGGVKVVMDLAFDDGADAVWILDDDSWPQANALKALLDEPWDPHVVRHPLQIDPISGKFTWPLQITDGKGGWKLVWSEKEMPEGPRVQSRICWTGALLPKEVRKVVGPVNGALFIRGEDEEYPWRIEQAGFPQEAVRAAVMDHPGPQNVVQFQFLGKRFFFERGLSDWKLYYKVRNMVWLKRQQSGDIKALSMALTYLIAALAIEGPKCISILRRAIHDGWVGKLGKMI